MVDELFPARYLAMAEEEEEEEEKEDEEETEDEEEEESDEDSKSEADEKGEDEEEKDESEEGEESEDDKAPPPTRFSPKDHIIARLQKKNQKLQEQKEEGDDEEDESNLGPEDQKAVRQEVARVVAPYAQRQQEQADRQELAQFMRENPKFAAYQAKVWKFWQHESRHHLPLRSVAYEVAGENLYKLGAKRGEAADRKARETRAPGNPDAPLKGGKKDYSRMSDKKIADIAERVKSGMQK